MQLSPNSIQAVKAEVARRRLKAFVQLYWSTIEPSALEDGWYLDAICEHLEALASGQIRNLIINLPPRHSKSLTAVFFSAWLWASHPEIRFLCSSYALQLSMRDNVKARRIIESELFQGSYPCPITSDTNRQNRFENSKGGFRLAVSVESSTLGEGGDYLIIDDPNNITEIGSDLRRKEVHRWYSEVMSTRLNDPKTGKKLLIQQRCDEEDLTGHILENDLEGNWCRLVLPYEYNSERSMVTCLGWSDPRTTEGELLSNRIPAKMVPAYKRDMGSIGFASQYNQNPIPAEGKLIKRDWFRYYVQTDQGFQLDDGRAFKFDDCYLFACADLAITSKGASDYTAVSVCAVSPEYDLVIVFTKRARVEGPKIIPLLKAIQKEYPVMYFGIESVAAQEYIIQQARKDGLPVKALRPTGGKEARSLALQIRMEGGQVFFPKQEYPWMADVYTELLSFPHSRWDDLADSLFYCAVEVSKRDRRRAARVETVTTETDEEREQRMEWTAMTLGT